MTGCPYSTIFCHFFDFITKTTVPQRTRGPAVTVEALIQEKKNKSRKGQNHLLDLGCDK